MPPRGLVAFMLVVCSIVLSAQQKPATANLRIVVIAGEGAVNIIQQKTAVAPIVEIRDRNNLPVASASVTFSVSGSGATFGSGSTLTVVTNAAGQATAAGFTPTAAGAVQINVSAAFQGQTAVAAITQTNFATAAQAAAAAGSATSSTAGTAAGTGAGAGGGGIGLGTIGIIGAAVAGGAVVATQTDLLKGDSAFVTIRGEVYATIRFGGECTVPAGGGDGSGQNIPRDCYGPAVSGAVVSTTLDGVTATTDGAGFFDLITTILEKDAECRTYTITISAAGQPTYSIQTRGFATSNSTHRQRFALNPPTPSFMNGGC